MRAKEFWEGDRPGERTSHPGHHHWPRSEIAAAGSKANKSAQTPPLKSSHNDARLARPILSLFSIVHRYRDLLSEIALSLPLPLHTPPLTLPLQQPHHVHEHDEH